MANNDLDRILKKMDGLASAASEAVNSSHIKSGAKLASLQRALAPEDTGALKNSIAVTHPGQATPPYSQPGGSRVAQPNEVIVTAGDSDTRYAHLVEYGTSQAEARPFFWLALSLLRNEITRNGNAAARRVIRKKWNGNKPGGDSDA